MTALKHPARFLLLVAGTVRIRSPFKASSLTIIVRKANSHQTTEEYSNLLTNPR
ncbi:hypothetical protein HPP92_029139 [Vanilla planifolia]|uniref:Uncharacterized protein n=1 Tax=Vanilla planifolia TaxID=51239 RepID=A0A835P2X2_VANPL|nr:hypothetical protein HPP92_029139 [Vanilla planifolia]KAG0445850.1 hypothetical protein HPP92_029128 [Vanilla planifolia]